MKYDGQLDGISLIKNSERKSQANNIESIRIKVSPGTSLALADDGLVFPNFNCNPLISESLR